MEAACAVTVLCSAVLRCAVMCIQLLKAPVPALALDRFSLGIDEESVQSRVRCGHCDGYLHSSPLLPHDAITALCSLTLTLILNLTLTLILAPTVLFFSRLSFTDEGSVQCKEVVPVFASLCHCLCLCLCLSTLLSIVSQSIPFSCSTHGAAVMVISPSDSSIVTPSTLAEAEAAVAAAAAAFACVFEYMYV
jgi:hypothetical protein